MLASQSIVILLCGNKKDLDTDREVTFLEASRFAQENGKSPPPRGSRGGHGCSAGALQEGPGQAELEKGALP